MSAIEAVNPDLSGVLPQTYDRLDNGMLFELLKIFNSIPMDIEGDAFGKIYEYFLGKFAMSEGQKGGEFFTPTSIVRLIVEIIEPYHGTSSTRPAARAACSSRSRRVRRRRTGRTRRGISRSTARSASTRPCALCRMNLAVHGLLAGEIRAGQHLLRGRSQRRRPLRLRHGQSALQRQQGR